jgi:hypothetical protein
MVENEPGLYSCDQTRILGQTSDCGLQHGLINVEGEACEKRIFDQLRILVTSVIEYHALHKLRSFWFDSSKLKVEMGFNLSPLLPIHAECFLASHGSPGSAVEVYQCYKCSRKSSTSNTALTSDNIK